MKCTLMKTATSMLLILAVANSCFGELEQTAPNGFNKNLLHKLGRNIQNVIQRYQTGVEKFATEVVKGRWFSKLFVHGPFGHQPPLLRNVFDPDLQRVMALPYNKHLELIPLSEPFPCNITNGRSPTKPTSVNRLRPGDIDLVAQFGDSIAHGTGLISGNSMGFYQEDNHLAMFIGGRDTWRRYITLPNILKEYNPRLIGFSTSPLRFGEVNKSTYDFAESGSSVKDMLLMSKKFIKRAKKDPRVNFEEDWKLLTIFMGGIDYCHYICLRKDKEKALQELRKSIEDGLDYLKANSPRTVVNFVVYSNFLRIVNTMKDVPSTCQAIQRAICNCLFGVYKDKEEEYLKILDKAAQTQFDAASNPKYQDKEDFTVLAQFFSRDVKLPMLNSVSNDYRYLAVDCVHWSQRTHAAFAVAAWNALITPFGNKFYSFQVKRPLTAMKCPSEDIPYIATPRNSRPSVNITLV